MIVNSSVCPPSVHHPSIIRPPSVYHPSIIRPPSVSFPAFVILLHSLNSRLCQYYVGDVIAFLRGRARIALGLDQLTSIAAALTTV